jgi:hypothetical protein
MEHITDLPGVPVFCPGSEVEIDHKCPVIKTRIAQGCFPPPEVASILDQ